MALNYRDIVHPEDEKALRQLQNTPGVKLIAEKIVNMGYEKFYRNLYMADYVKLGPDQLPEIYNLLPPIAEKLGIEQIMRSDLLAQMFNEKKGTFARES